MNTAEYIDYCVEKDQGASFRAHLKERMFMLTDAFSVKESSGRGHVGASVIGDSCARKIWFNFRCASGNMHSGRIHRLFNRGHLEEARFEALLLTIGCEVWTHDDNGVQFRFADIGNHFGGSIDGVVRGIPEMPDTPVLAEYKTHSEKSFNLLKGKGLLSAHEKHFIQMQVYMHYFKLMYGLYLAVNKNTDELYSEIIPYREESARMYIDRARNIILSQEMPPRVNENPGWWQCKFCGLVKKCHEDVTYKVKDKACRNCAYAETTLEGWVCKKELCTVLLSGEDMLKPCGKWKLRPSIERMGK